MSLTVLQPPNYVSGHPAMLNNRYLILSALGRGGFGQTYLVEDMHSPSRRLRVVKQLKPQAADPELFPLIRGRFEREAATLERLGEATDQIPTLHAYFSEGGEFYLVQDWIEGRSIAQKVREGGRDVRRAASEGVPARHPARARLCPLAECDPPRHKPEQRHGPRTR